jgi:hypothetical protein
MNHTSILPPIDHLMPEEPRPDALDLLFEACVSEVDPPARREPPPGVAVGALVGFSEDGEPLVRLPAESGGGVWPARSMATVGADRLGAEVVLAFDGGDVHKPIILGLLAPSIPSTPQAASVEAIVDKERIELVADREITLRCGKASITLTQAGKILIRGAYVLSRSSGVNRIKGGSVQIN